MLGPAFRGGSAVSVAMAGRRVIIETSPRMSSAPRRLRSSACDARRDLRRQELYARDAYDAQLMSPAEQDRFLRAQIEKWVRVVREAGIKLE